MSNGEYKELLEFLQDEFGKVEKHFDEVDKRFDEVDKRFDMMDGRITMLAVELKQEIRATREELNTRIDELYKATDGYIAMFRKVDTELVAMQAKYERLDERIARLEKFMVPH